MGQCLCLQTARAQSTEPATTSGSSSKRSRLKAKLIPKHAVAAPLTATMASLTIRNLTSIPLELKSVERFEGLPAGGTGVNATISNITSTISGFINSTALPVGGGFGVLPQGDVIHRQDVSVAVGPFETREVPEIRAPDPGAREVVRLAVEAPPGSGRVYATDAPAPSARSSVMRKVAGDGPDDQFTAVYVASGGFLAVLSSAALADWMGRLADEYPLSALSMPGTHNSPTCHTALPSVRCQAVGVREQLDNGVRFLDVRVSIDAEGGADLALVHSAFPISLTGTKYFRALVDDVCAFLDAHPRETVVMSVKREGTGKGSDQQLSKVLKEHYATTADRWFLEPRIPTLGEARGKVVLVRRFALDDSLRGEHGGAGWALDAQSWPDNCADGTVGSGLIRVQDFYEVDQSTNIEKKIELARAQLERAGEVVFPKIGGQGFAAAAAAAPPPFFVNFLSASNFFNANCWPDRIAARVNPGVIEYLCMRHGEHGKGPGQLAIGDAGTGVVVTDWVGNNGDWDLVRCIVAMNAKLQIKQ